jgi:hypothetical protein
VKRCVPLAANIGKASGEMAPTHRQPHRSGLAAVELHRHHTAVERIRGIGESSAIPYAIRSSGTLSTSAIFFNAAVVPFLRPLSRSEM